MRRCFTFLSVLVAVFVSSAVLAYTAKPIPCGNKPSGERLFAAALARFNHRMFADAYNKYGVHNTKWDADTRKFFEAYAAITAGAGNPAEYADLIKDGKALMQAGCSDPLLITCVGILMCRSNQWMDADPVLEKATVAFQSNKTYPKYCAALAPKYLLIARQKTKDTNPGSFEKWKKLAALWIAQSQTDGSFLPGEMRLRFECARTATAVPGLLEATCAVMKKQPKMDQYFLKVLSAQCEVDAAWKSRGSGWAYTVSATGWKGFEQHLAVARKLLMEAWKLHPEYPQAPTAMILLAQTGAAGPGETPRMWFDRAVAACWDYSEAYSGLEYALLPRWTGSVEEMYAFGAECARTKRYDSGVPSNLVTELVQIEKELNGKKDYWTSEKTANLLNTMLDGYEKKGDDNARAQARSYRAALAWYTGKEDDAKRLLKDLGDKVDDSCFVNATGVPYRIAKISLETGKRMWEPVKWSENGHYYQICRPAACLTYSEAKALAQSMAYAGYKGHLATPTSIQEFAFIGCVPHTSGYYWAGAARPRAKEDGWEWVTSEPWSFTAFPMSTWTIPGKADIALTLWSGSGSVAEDCNDFSWIPGDQDCYLEGLIVEYE
jgi:hypothetical protein